MSKDDVTFAIMAKPVGSRCNLHCTYCYYLGKDSLLGQEQRIMPSNVLESYVRQNYAAHGKVAQVEFAWHGGEPLLAGVDFYEFAIWLQKKYGAGRKTVNTLQTNGILLNDEWCSFFKSNEFLLGVSIDGPESLNIFRDESFSQVEKGLELLKAYHIPFNTLSTINAANSKYPQDVYLFLRQYTDFMQFLPVVESLPMEREIENGQRFASPPGINTIPTQHFVTDFSVNPTDFGSFLCSTLDIWLKLDFGKKHIQFFEATIGNMTNRPAGLCTHEPTCGHSAVIEANGDVYSCDRYAYPAYKIGNILDVPLETLLQRNKKFGLHKTYGLPSECFACKYLRLCFGGCPKDRIFFEASRQGVNYLCQGYKMFFEHFTQVYTENGTDKSLQHFHMGNVVGTQRQALSVRSSLRGVQQRSNPEDKIR